MIKNIAISMAVAAVITGVAACNSDTEEYHTELDGSAIVSKFSLVENKKVLADIDSVYFSIDLASGDIYNADSLPLGTRITALAANITTDNASAVTLYIPRPGMTDSVVDYLQHSSDTIDFSNGPVRLEVTSQSSLTKKSYNVRINVHKVKSDSLCWGSTAFAPLPAPQGTTAQRTVRCGAMTYTFSTDGNSYSVAATGDYASWEPTAFTPGFKMNVNSIVAGDNKFYALADNGTLYSADAATGPWVSKHWHFQSLYGVYGDELIGMCTDVNYPGIIAYPSARTIPVPDDFPLSDFSPAVTLSAEGLNTAQLLITGGRDTYGALSRDTYGFDGNSWTKLSRQSLPEGLEGVTVAPYYSLRNQKIAWRVDVLPTLLAFGGRKANGKINNIVYMSRDWGMHWQKADSLLQPTPEMPAVYGAQTLVASRRMSPARSSVWYEFSNRRLPLGARLETLPSVSRAVAPVTEWDAPYIYLFGGYDADGRLNTEIWRGVINRFTFTPIQ